MSAFGEGPLMTKWIQDRAHDRHLQAIKTAKSYIPTQVSPKLKNHSRCSSPPSTRGNRTLEASSRKVVRLGLCGRDNNVSSPQSRMFTPSGPSPERKTDDDAAFEAVLSELTEVQPPPRRSAIRLPHGQKLCLDTYTPGSPQSVDGCKSIRTNISSHNLSPTSQYNSNRESEANHKSDEKEIFNESIKTVISAIHFQSGKESGPQSPDREILNDSIKTVISGIQLPYNDLDVPLTADTNREVPIQDETQDGGESIPAPVEEEKDVWTLPQKEEDDVRNQLFLPSPRVVTDPCVVQTAKAQDHIGVDLSQAHSNILEKDDPNSGDSCHLPLLTEKPVQGSNVQNATPDPLTKKCDDPSSMPEEWSDVRTEPKSVRQTHGIRSCHDNALTASEKVNDAQMPSGPLTAADIPELLNNEIMNEADFTDSLISNQEDQNEQNNENTVESKEPDPKNTFEDHPTKMNDISEMRVSASPKILVDEQETIDDTKLITRDHLECNNSSRHDETNLIPWKADYPSEVYVPPTEIPSRPRTPIRPGNSVPGWISPTTPPLPSNEGSLKDHCSPIISPTTPRTPASPPLLPDSPGNLIRPTSPHQGKDELCSEDVLERRSTNSSSWWSPVSSISRTRAMQETKNYPIPVSPDGKSPSKSSSEGASLDYKELVYRELGIPHDYQTDLKQLDQKSELKEIPLPKQKIKRNKPRRRQEDLPHGLNVMQRWEIDYENKRLGTVVRRKMTSKSSSYPPQYRTSPRASPPRKKEDASFRMRGQSPMELWTIQQENERLKSIVNYQNAKKKKR